MNRKQKEPQFLPGLGWEFDLDESTCDARTLAYFDRPESERTIPLKEWNVLYEARMAEQASRNRLVSN